jgi:dTDP-4-amino-4,6-dideoxygalactose transaminase
MTDQAPIPMLDLHAQYAQVKTEVEAAIAHVIASQHFINGPDVEALETELAAYCQAKHAVGVSSGSDALIVALMALDVGPGDEVLTTPYTFFATAGAIARLGAKPVFADIDPVTFNIDPRALAAKITPRTKAIIPVHLFGQCADMGPILEVARKCHLPVIEDAAQAIGAEYQGQRAGSMGTIGCFSFFPSKNLGALGDGGACTTNDTALYEKMKLLRGHGSQPKYYHKIVGGNFRLDTIHAAVLRVKLKYLDGWTAGRQRGAAYYTDLFARHGLEGNVAVTPRAVQSRHIFNQYVVRVADRDAVRESLRRQQITTEIYYPVPMHVQECFAYLGYRQGAFPESERAAASTVALPMYPELTNTQRERVVRAVAGFYQASVRRAA